MEDKQWLLKLSQLKNATRKVTIITRGNQPQFNATLNDNDVFDYVANSEFLSSLSLLTLIILYGIVIFGGVVGNSTLLISLCSQSTSRVKNPLLLALCTADLLVSLVSAPITIVGVILRMQSRTMSLMVVNIGCKVFHYLQVIFFSLSSVLTFELIYYFHATLSPSITEFILVIDSVINYSSTLHCVIVVIRFIDFPPRARMESNFLKWNDFFLEIK
jgi:hypothetical protein